MSLNFIANQSKTTNIRRETVDGVQYVVAPTVLIQFEEDRAGGEPGIVLNGELLTISQVCPLVNRWSGIPAPLGHPQVDGQFVSARDRDDNVGLFKNAHCKNNALQGEFWIEAGDDDGALARLEAGELINVSSAYFRDPIGVTGIFNGKPYKSIASNLQPDHAAILLDETGACSLDDGCGAPRVNKETQMKIFTTNIELSLTEQDEQVWQAWWDQGVGKGRIFKILPDVIITATPGHLWIIPYTASEDEVVFEEAIEADIMPVEEPATNNTPGEQQPAGNINHFSKMVEMATNKIKEVLNVDRNRVIQELVANERCRLSEATLKKFDDEELKTFAESLQEQEPGDGSQPPPEPAQAEQPPGWARPLFDGLKRVGETVQSLGQAIQANADKEKAPLVQQIAAHSDFSEEELGGKSLAELRKLHKAIRIPVADYSGLGVNFQADAGEWENYESPEFENGNGGGK